MGVNGTLVENVHIQVVKFDTSTIVGVNGTLVENVHIQVVKFDTSTIVGVNGTLVENVHIQVLLLTAHELLFRRKKIENFSRLEHTRPGLPISDGQTP